MNRKSNKVTSGEGKPEYNG